MAPSSEKRRKRRKASSASDGKRDAAADEFREYPLEDGSGVVVSWRDTAGARGALVLEGVASVEVLSGSLRVHGNGAPFLLRERNRRWRHAIVCGNAAAGSPARLVAASSATYQGPRTNDLIQAKLRSVDADPHSSLRYCWDGSDTGTSFACRFDRTATPAPGDAEMQWNRAAEDIAEASLDAYARFAPAPALTTLVCGAKNAGKSTFCRALLNALVGSDANPNGPHIPAVAYLEADCGQPEFTPPGMVSLVFVDGPTTGPSFMHPRRPAKAFFLGDTSQKADPMLYVNSIVALLGWYHAHGLEALEAHVAARHRARTSSPAAGGGT